MSTNKEIIKSAIKSLSERQLFCLLCESLANDGLVDSQLEISLELFNLVIEDLEFSFGLNMSLAQGDAAVLLRKIIFDCENKKNETSNN